MMRSNKLTFWCLPLSLSLPIACGDGGNDENGGAAGSSSQEESDTRSDSDTGSDSNTDPDPDRADTNPGSDNTDPGGDDKTDPDADPGEACSSGTEGLTEGDLMPDAMVKHCDGTEVSLRSLVCGNRYTQLYSSALWCPVCQGFSYGDSEDPPMGDEIYDEFHADGFEQVIILSNNASKPYEPTMADCADLQEHHKGLVVFDPTTEITEDVYGLAINSGSALLSADATWVIAPKNKDGSDNDDADTWSVSWELDDLL